MNLDLPMPPHSAFADGRLMVTEILGRETSSILRPLECIASDEKRYFIKTRSSDMMPLICEWICSRLAHALGLRCPPVCIAWLPAPLVQESIYSGYDLVPGWAFGSQAVELADTFPKAATHQVPAEERRRLLAFDHWIHNTDRQDSNPNLLWRATESTLWVIDHHLTLSPTPIRHAQTSHIFRDDWQDCWTGAQGKAIRTWLQTGRDHLDAILAELPVEWRKTAGDFEEKTRILLHRALP